MLNRPVSSHGTVHVAPSVAHSFGCTRYRRPPSPPEQLDHQFLAMLDAYRDLGGLSCAQEVFTIYKSRQGRDIAGLARCIAKRDVLSFDWHAQVWL